MTKATRSLLLTLAVSTALPGCGWIRERWSWKKAETPVTEPAEQIALRDDDAPRPATAGQPDDSPFAPLPELDDPRPQRPADAAAPAPAPEPADANAASRVDKYAAELSRPEPAPPVEPVETAPAEPADTPAPAESDVDLSAENTELVAAPGIVVNGEFIPIQEILVMVGPQLRAIPDSASKGEFQVQAARILQQAIQHKVQTSVIQPEVEEALTDQQKAIIERDLEEKLRKLIASHGGSRKKLEDELAEQGITLEQYLELQRQDAMQQAYLFTRFGPSITVTRRELMSYYKAHKQSDYVSGKKVQMQLIAIPVPARASDAARAEAREQIDQAAAALAEGKDFGEVAREYSRIMADNGGLWPPMQRDAGFRAKEVIEKVFEMDPGEVSGVIESDAGYFIVKARKVIPGKTVSFEQAQEEIEEKLRAEKSEKLWKEYYAGVWEKSLVVPQEQLIRRGVEKATAMYWRQTARP